MKKISSYWMAGLVLLAATSCTNSDFKKTKSGLLYKIIGNGQGEKAKVGQFLKVNVVQKIRDSVIYTSEGSMPVYMPVDSARPIYSHTEILSMLRKGDSAVVVLLADSLQKKFGGQLPPFIKKKDKISITFKVLNIFPNQEQLMADRTQEMAKEKDRETATVESYLAANKITAEKTPQGTYVVVTTPGDGPLADSGKQVSVHYTGKLMATGKVFQSNFPGAEGSQPGNDKPFSFVIGRHMVVPGWDDGLRKFRKGGKGTLYIPAFMGYDQQPGPGGKPYENLIFDIEVTDVTDAPPAPAAPAFPGGMGGGMPQGRPQAGGRNTPPPAQK